jgi:hypothetical protein
MHMTDNPFIGKWTYRSFLNDPDQFLGDDNLDDKTKQQKLMDLVFGAGTIEIVAAPPNILKGTIGGSDWQLELYGSRSYGNPMAVWFQGSGTIGKEKWIYDYLGYLVPQWPDGIQQRAAMVGSIVRVIPHSGSDGTVHPAGVVASWYAVQQSDPC